ncbi:multi-sensor hybrid histidine kinase [Actinoplanes sp. SE50]|uniref:ATP-binding protein n=1 Tax=Actinoplanes sp. SE50 TaxID=2033844 RepID=UPI000C059E45|nr:ATP-binding protein [Actinoplanes sp. SE50]ATO79605.1 multi-sensor hybrid histidine kinase [Actinoplanes sp. SE50]
MGEEHPAEGDGDAGASVQQMELTAGAMSWEAANKLAAVTARAAGAPTALIHLTDGDHLRLAGGAGLPDGWKRIGHVPVSSGLAGIILGSGEPLIVTDTAADVRVPAGAPISAVAGRAYAGFPIRDPQGTLVGVCAVLDYQVRQWTDEELAGVREGAQACTAFVAEQQARQQADQQRRFLDALLASLQAGVTACDAQGRLVLANDLAVQWAGESSPPADLKQWAARQHLADAEGRPLPAHAVPLLRALAGEQLRDVEITVRNPGQRRTVLRTDAQPITGADGERLGAVVVAQDVTDQRRAARFRDVEFAVAEALAHASSVQQAGSRVLEAICSTLHWPYAELWLVDEQAQALMPSAHYAADHVEAGELSPQPQPGDMLTGAAWRTGKPIWIGDIDAAPGNSAAPGLHLRTGLAIPVPSGGRVLAVLSFFADVVEDPADSLIALLSGTAAHVGEFLERRRAEELALALARTKDEYLVLVGHELRTPLTSISGCADFLLTAEPAVLLADAPELLEIIARNSRTVLHIVDELLDLTGLDSGHTIIACEPVDLAAAVRSAAATAAPAAESAGVEMGLQLAAEPVVIGDHGRLQQVIGHLIANAIAHGQTGDQVSVTVTQPAPTVAEVTVTDTGIGIPAEERHRLFSRFYRSSRTRERRIPGAGLGLVLSRAIIERHHGTIQLNPDTGAATSVTVRLPTDRCEPQRPSPGAGTTL